MRRGVVPVTYTVRADHLPRGQPDDLRVHFGLQMKPLIRWRAPDDEQFRAQLERRLRATVLRNWNRVQKSLAAKSKEREAFGGLSVSRRLAAIRSEAMLSLRPYGFRSWHPIAVQLGLACIMLTFLWRLGFSCPFRLKTLCFELWPC
jgi:hypothetical protein